MRTFTQSLAKAPVQVHLVENEGDAVEFLTWCSSVLGTEVAVDTETTGLDVFAPDFRLLTVQFGTASQAWVIPMDMPGAENLVVRALSSMGRLIFHNVAYDALVLYATLGFDPVFLEGAVDTRILSHLLDPRSQHEGGTGHGLKQLAAVWVDSDAPDSQDALKARFRELGVSQAEGFKHLDPRDPVLVTYAGLDVILTWRVWRELSQLVVEEGLQTLSDFEHELQSCLIDMQRRGILLDVDYTKSLSSDLTSDVERFTLTARRYGVTNIGSTQQVAEALMGMGEVLTESTPSGMPKVDKAVLLPLADLDRDWKRLNVRQPNPLADAVLRAKRASKWNESYAQAFLDLADTGSRIHPWINGLQARTARMSVSRPPLQQLPSSDAVIRRALIADPGEVMMAVDYSQIEMRVLAGVSGDQTMINAIKSGVDLHDFTAEQLFGSEFTKHQRKIAKGVGFGKVYGGGAATLSRQTGADITDVRRAIAAYDRTYSGIAAYSEFLVESTDRGRLEVRTPSGRILPLDRDRVYAATNYIVQSTARDVLAQAIVNMFDAGLGEFLLLPIHDEVLAQAPERDAEEVLREMRKVMEEHSFMGVPMVSEGEIYGASWGHGYGWEGN